MISEIRRYVIDRKHYDHPRYFIFKNSICGYDVLRTTGDAQKDVNIDRTIVESPLPYNFTLKNHKSKLVQAIGTEVYKVNTGWK